MIIKIILYLSRFLIQGSICYRLNKTLTNAVTIKFKKPIAYVSLFKLIVARTSL